MRIIKSILMVLGGIFGLLFLTLIAFAGYFFISGEGPKLDAESKAWVDIVVPEIVSQWDKDALVNHSSPLLLETTTDEALGRLFVSFSEQFGNMKEYKGSEGQAGIFINNGVKTISAEYMVTVEFEKGPAVITVGGIKTGSKWEIVRFYVNPSK